MSGRSMLVGGLLLLIALWGGPLPEWSRSSFWAHMALHMGLVAVAGPMLAMGLAQSRFDPVRRWPRAFPAVPLSLIELLVVWAWHTPGAHAWARESWAGFILEQGMFLGVAVVLWIAVFGGGEVARAQRRAAGIAALLLTSMHMTLLGALLALTPRTLYLKVGDFCALDPLDDQHLGGAVMLIVGGIVYLSAGLWLTMGLLRARHSEEVLG